MHTGQGHNPNWGGQRHVLADVGTVQLENAALSSLTGADGYAARAHHTTLLLGGALKTMEDAAVRSAAGLAGVGDKTQASTSTGGGVADTLRDKMIKLAAGVSPAPAPASTPAAPIILDNASAASSLPPAVLLGAFVSSAVPVAASGVVTVGALADSYYEYLLKTWIATGKTNEAYRSLYVKSMNNVLRKLWVGPVFGPKEAQEDTELLAYMKDHGLLDAKGNSANYDKFALYRHGRAGSSSPQTGYTVNSVGEPAYVVPVETKANTGTETKAEAEAEAEILAAGAGAGAKEQIKLIRSYPQYDPFIPVPDQATDNGRVTVAARASNPHVRVVEGVLLDDGRPIAGYFKQLSPSPQLTMDHLTCFMGGVLALGVYSGAVTGELAKEHLMFGEQFTRTCAMLYIRSPTGLAPEETRFNSKYVFPRMLIFFYFCHIFIIFFNFLSFSLSTLQRRLHDSHQAPVPPPSRDRGEPLPPLPPHRQAPIPRVGMVHRQRS
jgi:hypothetical protein